MRAPAILLLLLSLSFAANFGYSRITIERTWDITTNSSFEFSGALVANDTNQKVLWLITEPEGLVSYADGNGTILLSYNGSNNTVLKARAIVDVDYDTSLTSDPWVPGGMQDYTELTEPDTSIALQAQKLARGDSSLTTIKDLVNWVHGYIKYDIGYWGQVRSAQEVFLERRGVCVEYAHLLISLARSLGFETRYVSGYVFTDVWQPHAWAEIYVPQYGWLPADATFGQVGILDSTHLAIRKTDDQSASYDLLLAKDEFAQITVEDNVTSNFLSDDQKGVALTMGINEKSYVAEVTLSNQRPEYVFGAYSTIMPRGFGGEESTVLLLRPKETRRLYHAVNQSMLEDGLLYTIPVTASFNDASQTSTFTVTPRGLEEENQMLSGGCLSFLLPLALAALWRRS